MSDQVGHYGLHHKTFSIKDLAQYSTGEMLQDKKRLDFLEKLLFSSTDALALIPNFHNDEHYVTVDNVNMYGMPGQISEDLLPLSNPTSIRETLDILMEQEEV